jgi:hypothetical protein
VPGLRAGGTPALQHGEVLLQRRYQAPAVGGEGSGRRLTAWWRASGRIGAGRATARGIAALPTSTGITRLPAASAAAISMTLVDWARRALAGRAQRS